MQVTQYPTHIFVSSARNTDSVSIHGTSITESDQTIRQTY